MQYVIDHRATQMAQEVLAPAPHLLFQEYLLSEGTKSTKSKDL